MRICLSCLLLLGAAALLPGCQSEHYRVQLPDAGNLLADGRTDAPSSVKPSDLAPAPDGLPASPGGPIIAIMAPLSGAIVIEPSLRVLATITDSNGVDPTSVTVTVQGQAPVRMSTTGQADRYEALVDLSQLGGSLRLWVIAGDVLGNRQSKLVTFRRDPGASIGFLSPGQDEHHKGSLLVKVTVEDQAAPKSFEVVLGEEKLALQRTTLSPTLWLYTGVLKFDQPFDPPLSGSQVLTATAVNQNQARTVVQRTFVVDDQGPSISIISHKEGQVVGGPQQLQATVTDPAGLLQGSVRCVIADGAATRTLALLPAGKADTYQAIFDPRSFGSNDLWPVLSFRAADRLGNESHVDIQIGLDDTPPTIELDPVMEVFVGRYSKGKLECSHPFNPVGSDAVNDRDLAPQITPIRALIEDRGNSTPSAKFVPLALVDEATVWLYILDDSSQALVVDTDQDGVCDSINPKLVPISSAPQAGKAIAVNLKGVPAAGSANFTPWADLEKNFPFGACGNGSEADPPNPLCQITTLTMALTYASGGQSSLYSIPPIAVTDKVACLGLPFDFGANKVSDGWACAAVAAADRAGNQGVSAPLRLYVQKGAPASQQGPAPGSAGAPPSCTGSYNPATGVVNNQTPCSFRGALVPAPQRFPAAALYLQ